VDSLQVNDIEMAYQERGDGPTVIALHAATVSSTEMGWLTRLIVHEGFNVIAPDLRGHGGTSNPAPDLHLTRLVDDLLEFVYLLGRAPVHGLGYSLGGAVILYAALRRPELFRTLVLLGTNYHAPSQSRIERVLGPFERRSSIQRQVFHPENGVGVGWDKPAAAFSAVPAPTLVICGDRDEFNDPEDSLALYRAMPRAEVLVIPRADHLGIVRHPMITHALLDFYKRAPR
jgi:pimeloyl-ACP methyl ester carboxylesterase